MSFCFFVFFSVNCTKVVVFFKYVDDFSFLICCVILMWTVLGTSQKSVQVIAQLLSHKSFPNTSHSPTKPPSQPN